MSVYSANVRAKLSSPAVPRKVYIVFLLLQGLLAFAAAAWISPALLLIVIAGTCMLCYSLLSFDKMLFMMLMYISIFPIASWGRRYSFFKHHVSYKLIIVFLVILALHWFIKSLRDKRTFVYLGKLDCAMLAFLLLVVFGALHGMLAGNRGLVLFGELLVLTFNALYLLYINYGVDRRRISNLWKVLYLITILVSIQYILVYLSEFNVFDVGLKRITTRQPHLALIALPYAYSTLAFDPDRKNKLFVILGLFPIFLMVLLSLQRGLWLAVVFSFAVFLFLYVIRSRLSLGRAAALLLLFLCLCTGSVMLLMSRASAITSSGLNKRVSSFGDLESDLSLGIRVLEIGMALEQAGPASILGRGLGAEITRPVTMIYSNIVDNAYVYIYWKLGWSGLAALLLVYGIFLRRSLSLTRQSQDSLSLIVGFSALTGMLGLMLVSLTNVSLVLYRFNLIWALVIASVTLLYREARAQKAT